MNRSAGPFIVSMLLRVICTASSFGDERARQDGAVRIVYHDKTTGTIVRATVGDCQVDRVKGVAVTCTGTWPVGGRRTHGVIDGVDIPDIGRTVMVHLHGGTAYAQTRLVAPAVFFFVGILVALGFVYAAWRTASAAASGSSPGQGLA